MSDVVEVYGGGTREVVEVAGGVVREVIEVEVPGAGGGGGVPGVLDGSTILWSDPTKPYEFRMQLDPAKGDFLTLQYRNRGVDPWYPLVNLALVVDSERVVQIVDHFYNVEGYEFRLGARNDDGARFDFTFSTDNGETFSPPLFSIHGQTGEVSIGSEHKPLATQEYVDQHAGGGGDSARLQQMFDDNRVQEDCMITGLEFPPGTDTTDPYNKHRNFGQALIDTNAAIAGLTNDMIVPLKQRVDQIEQRAASFAVTAPAIIDAFSYAPPGPSLVQAGVTADLPDGFVGTGALLTTFASLPEGDAGVPGLPSAVYSQTLDEADTGRRFHRTVTIVPSDDGPVKGPAVWSRVGEVSLVHPGSDGANVGLATVTHTFDEYGNATTVWTNAGYPLLAENPDDPTGPPVLAKKCLVRIGYQMTYSWPGQFNEPPTVPSPVNVSAGIPDGLATINRRLSDGEVVNYEQFTAAEAGWALSSGVGTSGSGPEDGASITVTMILIALAE